MQPAQALREPGEAGEGAPPPVGGEAPARVQARADVQGLAPGVEAKDLPAFDAPDLEAKAVRPHVDDGQRGRRR